MEGNSFEFISEATEVSAERIRQIYTKAISDAENALWPESVTNETRLDELRISVRLHNSLNQNGITTLGELCSKTESEIMRFRNLGNKTRGEMFAVLNKYSLKLKS